MKRITKEFLVGCLVLLVIGLGLGFGWLMGVLGPFAREVRYELLYGFAGGVEVGSPVRVSGVKVGKVDRIDFLPTSEKLSDSALKVTISVSQRAAPAIREDSKFYVNMAGIIGERYIEISPGSRDRPPLKPGSSVRGVDPPRIDQLLSQGYGVFGRIQDLIEENEDHIAEFLKQFNVLLKDANEFLKGQDRKKLIALIQNLNEVTIDIKGVSSKLNDPETKEIFKLLGQLVRRAHGIDKPALKKFLQEEGVRARIF
jgi:phospholipid/cholesterol/gamma-HCH transport system substrate-binding protein